MKNILFLTLIFIFLSGCGEKDGSMIHHDHEGEKDHEEKSETIKVSKQVQVNLGFETVEVSIKKLVQTIEVYGEIAQETEQIVHVASPESGKLETVDVELGSVVDFETRLAQLRTAAGTLLEIRSPSHGIVMGQYFKKGDHVDSLSSLFTIANPDMVRGSFDLYEKDLAAVAIGQRVEVETLSYPDKVYEGKVVYLSPRVDSETRTIKVRVDIKNTEEHELKFGMFVLGRIEKTLDEEALLIPMESLHWIEEKPTVFVQNEESEFEVRHIEINQSNSQFVEVLSGLKSGERIVTHGSFNLKSEFLKESLGGDGDGH